MALDLPDDRDARPPLPPLDLIDRVARPFGVDEADSIRSGFDTYPQLQLRALERALALVGREFADFRRLLDFGCGPGRYLRHLGPLAATTEIHGADIDGEAIEWLRANLPFGRYTTIPPEPPTTYDDGTFDLVINHSVFTHLDERMQDLWLAELRRITAPGAILLLTVHSGAEWRQAVADIAMGDAAVAGRWHDRLDREGIVFIGDDHFIGSVHPDAYHTTFHAPWYVHEHWTRWFDLVAYVPDGADVQDLVVLRRPEGGDPPDVEDRAARPDDPPAPDADPARAVLAALERRVAAPPPAPPTSLVARLRARLAARGPAGPAPDGGAAVDPDVVAALALVLDRVDAQRDALAARERELAMLRVGIYEQGRRMSLIAHQLREELGAGAPPTTP